MAKERLDAELVRRRLVHSRQEARAAIEAGRVLVSGARATKPSRLVDRSESIVVEGPPQRFVSRGGEKLDHALETFKIEVAGKRALDLGASTGGFTDCLLRRGAAEVVAVDVGRGLLDWRLRRDPRVVLLERTNARHLDVDRIGGPVDVVTADLSFISLRLVLPAVVRVAAAGADIVMLVKPQFEVGRAAARRGVVRDPSGWREALCGVRSAAEGAGIGVVGVCASPLVGPAGNLEFFLHGRRGRVGTLNSGDIEAVVEAAAREPPGLERETAESRADSDAQKSREQAPPSTAGPLGNGSR